mmetsp:Transcript_50130/g.143345  ORF Transcript_50130/g.143345 Transcript_50130/m.143345 type:complete len:208 (-) Transcript_50130:1347-1970(-)
MERLLLAGVQAALLEPLVGRRRSSGRRAQARGGDQRHRRAQPRDRAQAERHRAARAAPVRVRRAGHHPADHDCLDLLHCPPQQPLRGPEGRPLLCQPRPGPRRAALLRERQRRAGRRRADSARGHEGGVGGEGPVHCQGCQGLRVHGPRDGRDREGLAQARLHQWRCALPRGSGGRRPRARQRNAPPCVGLWRSAGRQAEGDQHLVH